MDWTKEPIDLPDGIRDYTFAPANLRGLTVLVFRSSSTALDDAVRPHHWIVKAVYNTTDAVTGKPGYYESVDEHWCFEPPSLPKIVMWAKATALSLLEHELEEGLAVDGIRHLDPHRSDPVDPLATGVD